MTGYDEEPDPRLLNREVVVMENFFGSVIERIVIDARYREYVEVHTNNGSFYITCFNPVTGETRDWIHIDESVS